MNPNLVSAEAVAERVQELVASVESYARMTRTAIATGLDATDLSAITVSLATELATMLGKGRLTVERSCTGLPSSDSGAGWEVSRES